MNLLGKEVYSPSEESGVIIKVWEDFVYVQFADRVEKVPLSSWSLWKSSEKWKAKDKIVECYMSMLYRKIVLSENVRFGKSTDDLSTFLNAHGWCGEAPEWVKNSAAKDMSQEHFLTVNYNYGTVAQDIYISCCKEFGWDEEQKEKFGEQNVLYAKEATQEGFSPWFLAKHNWNEPVEKIEDMQGRCFMRYHDSGGDIAEFWLEPPEDFYSDWTGRIVFANSENGYVFLGECMPSEIRERIIDGKRIYEKSYKILNEYWLRNRESFFPYDEEDPEMGRKLDDEVETGTYNKLSSTSELCKRFDAVCSRVWDREYEKDFQKIRDDEAVALLLDVCEQTYGMTWPVVTLSNSNLCRVSSAFSVQNELSGISYSFSFDVNSIYQKTIILMLHNIKGSKILFFALERHFGFSFLFEYCGKNGLRRLLGWGRC